MKRTLTATAVALAAAGLGVAPIAQAASQTDAEPMATGLNGWSVDPIFTVGETIGSYTPVGILDGTGAFPGTERTRSSQGDLTVTANHELSAGRGYTYTLANGTELDGARVSTFTIQSETLKVKQAALAYDTVVGYDGTPITEASQINPLNDDSGIDRLCSARGVLAGQYGFEDHIFFTGEETGNGLLFALDVEGRSLHAVPNAGLLAWESVSPVETGDPDTIALVVGDDRQGAPLWLYVGHKGGTGFLERNGLAEGTLYAWKATTVGVDSPAEFSGHGSTESGTWVAIDTMNPDGTYRSTDELDAAALDAGAFEFSRPEDVHDNPADASQVVLASTGRQTWDGASDVWGTTYLIDIDFEGATPVGADLEIVYDGDQAFAEDGIDDMLRSPDNLVWASDGMVYLQEDRAVSWAGATEETSIWALDPAVPGEVTRVAQVDRSAVPDGQVDIDPTDLGDWETSGIIDVSDLVKGNDTVLLFDIQAHSLRGGAIDSLDLVQGGQLAVLRR